MAIASLDRLSDKMRLPDVNRTPWNFGRLSGTRLRLCARRRGPGGLGRAASGVHPETAGSERKQNSALLLTEIKETRRTPHQATERRP